ncbi:MAG: sce7726 family protein [Tannerellaceae bacterium]|nr:sce7726 family protein [Tannerellaceae bacterium]
MNVQAEKMRSYSSIFSSTSFAKLLTEDDYTFIKSKVDRYDNKHIGKKFVTYLDYISYIYKQLQQDYQCEYIYKNTIINQLLIKEYGTQNTLAVNEFKVANSIADLVLFNGTSKAFEIKTELDSSKRLDTQLHYYTKLFKECYLVTHENLANKYLSTPDNIGIIIIKPYKGSLILEEIRAALPNKIDPSILMRSIRTPEYKNIVKTYYGYLPEMNSFNMFEICHNLIKQIPVKELHDLFVSELKKRRSNTNVLKFFPKELRQLCLSMNISIPEYNNLENILLIPIKS